jgi:hypothetical protein
MKEKVISYLIDKNYIYDGPIHNAESFEWPDMKFHEKYDALLRKIYPHKKLTCPEHIKVAAREIGIEPSELSSILNKLEEEMQTQKEKYNEGVVYLPNLIGLIFDRELTNDVKKKVAESLKRVEKMK